MTLDELIAKLQEAKNRCVDGRAKVRVYNMRKPADKHTLYEVNFNNDTTINLGYE